MENENRTRQFNKVLGYNYIIQVSTHIKQKITVQEE